MTLASKKIAALCLLLTLWSAVAFVAHHHSSANESLTCQVCLAAHSAAPVDAAGVVSSMFLPVDSCRPEEVPAERRVIAFALSVRPPPAV